MNQETAGSTFLLARHNCRRALLHKKLSAREIAPDRFSVQTVFFKYSPTHLYKSSECFFRFPAIRSPALIPARNTTTAASPPIRFFESELGLLEKSSFGKPFPFFANPSFIAPSFALSQSPFRYYSFSCHSASLNPVKTVSPSITSGRFTNIPSEANNSSCSSSDMDAS